MLETVLDAFLGHLAYVSRPLDIFGVAALTRQLQWRDGGQIVTVHYRLATKRLQGGLPKEDWLVVWEPGAAVYCVPVALLGRRKTYTLASVVEQSVRTMPVGVRQTTIQDRGQVHLVDQPYRAGVECGRCGWDEWFYLDTTPRWYCAVCNALDMAAG